MHREILNYLLEWLARSERQPLVIRGARQVGKTWAVRELAARSKRKLVEINFEKRIEYVSLFNSNDPQQILLQIGAAFGFKIDPQETLLFLDEVQAYPELLAKLRWFAEEMPELPILAAGSLLEFVLTDHNFSMPVGRISYVHMEPLSFEEFLAAQGKDILLEYLRSYDLTTPLPLALHEQCILLFKEFLLVGGLPAAVKDWVNHKDLLRISEIHHNIVATYRDDFAKYRGRLDIARLEEVFAATPKLLGQPFKYSHVNNVVSSGAIKQALELLCKARICHRVRSTHGNGLPLGAEAHSKKFKVIFLDVGLCSAALGLSYNQLMKFNAVDLVNKGGLAEQVVGQLLRTIHAPYIEPILYFWERDTPGTISEIDYLIAHGSQIVPIEVKAGTTGTLKSLHIFMGLKELPLAVRINADVPRIHNIPIKTSDEKSIQYQLISIPFYLLGQLHRLLNAF